MNITLKSFKKRTKLFKSNKPLLWILISIIGITFVVFLVSKIWLASWNTFKSDMGFSFRYPHGWYIVPEALSKKDFDDGLHFGQGDFRGEIFYIRPVNRDPYINSILTKVQGDVEVSIYSIKGKSQELLRGSRPTNCVEEHKQGTLFSCYHNTLNKWGFFDSMHLETGSYCFNITTYTAKEYWKNMRWLGIKPMFYQWAAMRIMNSFSFD